MEMLGGLCHSPSKVVLKDWEALSHMLKGYEEPRQREEVQNEVHRIPAPKNTDT